MPGIPAGCEALVRELSQASPGKKVQDLI
jgi:hypothetical protein